MCVCVKKDRNWYHKKEAVGITPTPTHLTVDVHVGHGAEGGWLWAEGGPGGVARLALLAPVHVDGGEGRLVPPRPATTPPHSLGQPGIQLDIHFVVT